VSIVLKSGNLSLLEHLGLVEACNWIALPFTKVVSNIGQIIDRNVPNGFCGSHRSVREDLLLPGCDVMYNDTHIHKFRRNIKLPSSG